MGLVSSSQRWDPSGQALCGLCMLPDSVGSYVLVLLCLEGRVDIEFIAPRYRENENPTVLGL